MAFPASPSNNQVHKENNRAFVYDSALGTWDQVKESVADRLSHMASVVLPFPSGHVVKTTFKGCSTGLTLNNTREIHCTAAQGIEALEVTAGNKLAIWFMGGNHYTSTNSPYYSTLKIVVTDGAGDSHYETAVFGAVGSEARFDPISAFAFHTIAANTNTVNIRYGIRGNYISASYNFYLTPTHYDSGDTSGMRFVVQEIQA